MLPLSFFLSSFLFSFSLKVVTERSFNLALGRSVRANSAQAISSGRYYSLKYQRLLHTLQCDDDDFENMCGKVAINSSEIVSSCAPQISVATTK